MYVIDLQYCHRAFTTSYAMWLLTLSISLSSLIIIVHSAWPRTLIHSLSTNFRTILISLANKYRLHTFARMQYSSFCSGGVIALLT